MKLTSLRALITAVEEGSLQEGMQIAASASADMADGMQVLALPQA